MMRKDLPLTPSKGGKTLFSSMSGGADVVVGNVVGVLVSGGEDAPPNDTPASDDIPDPIKPGGGN